MPRPIERALGPVAAFLLLVGCGASRRPDDRAAEESAPAATISAAVEATGRPASPGIGLADELLVLMNRTRAEAGLPPLGADGHLFSSADRQASSMATAGALFHQPLGDELDLGWSRVGENVGFGPNAPAIHRALVASPGHYANLVNNHYDRVGIAVRADDTGRLWVAQVFGG